MPKVVGALAGLPGIIAVDAFYPEKEARVEYDPALIGTDRILEILSHSGYASVVKEPAELPSAFRTPGTHGLQTNGSEDLICYCFGFTRAAIEQDYIQNGRSLILERIAAEKKAGGCDCVHKNPKGR